MPSAQNNLNFNKLNLNLLRVFDCVFRTRSITEAAECLGVTQSAVSHSLAQLRSFFGDELFLKTPTAMVPTTLALDVGVRVAEALTAMKQSIMPRTFQPLSSTRTFTIACADYTNVVLLPDLVQAFRKRAPYAKLRTQPMSANLVERLDSGSVDLVVSGFDEIPYRLDSEVLFGEPVVWIVPRDLAAGLEADPERLYQMGHVVVDLGLGDDDSNLSTFARRQGLSLWTSTAHHTRARGSSPARPEDMVVHGFVAAAMVVESTDLVSVVPSKLARRLASRLAIGIIDGGMPGRDVRVVWHREYGNHSPILWLRSLISELFAEPLAHQCRSTLDPSRRQNHGSNDRE